SGSSGPTKGFGGGASSDSGEAQNTTYAAISDGDITIRSNPNQSLDELKKSKEEAHRVLERIFSEDKVDQARETAELTQVFAEEAYIAIGDLYKPMEDTEALLRHERNKENPNQAIIDLLEQSLAAQEANLPISKPIAHAIAGGLTAVLGGGNFMQGAMAAGLSEAAAGQLAEALPDNKTLRNFAVVMLGGAIGGTQGALITGTADKFNRQLHPTEIDWIEENAGTFAAQEGITPDQAMERLAQQALRDLDVLWYLYLSPQEDNEAKAFLNTQATFENEDQEQQQLFTATEDDFLRPGKYLLDRADRNRTVAFYQRYVQTGIQRDAVTGLKQELKAKKDALAELYRNADSDTVKEAITEFIDETGESLQRGYEKVKDDPWGTVKEGVKGAAEGIADAGEAMVDEGKVALLGDEEMLTFYGREDAVTAQRLIAAVRVGGNAAALLGLTKVAKYGAEKAADGLGGLKDKVEELAKKERPAHESGRKGVENANANVDGDFDALNQEPKAANFVDLSAGCKGAWCRELNKPEPNTNYRVDENYSFSTDHLGRTVKVEGSLNLDKNDRNGYQQCKAGKCGADDDEGGHLIASIFKGPGEKINLVPMNGSLNRGEWRRLEKTWEDALKEGQSVNVAVEPVYAGSSARPESFKIKYSIDNGRPIFEVFQNTPGGK
ncbi:MAG: DNA/RNA non-specific endonuclease, partial [Sedimenticola sp.]|nr:DNA/RNA non-specific endonuclease [Sedimenticola sp.]